MSHQRHVLPNVIWFGISSWSSRRHHCCTWNVLQCATRISTAKKNMKKYSSQHPMHLSIHQNENELSLSSRHKCAVLPSPSSQSASFIRTLTGICRAQIESRHLVCKCVCSVWGRRRARQLSCTYAPWLARIGCKCHPPYLLRRTVTTNISIPMIYGRHLKLADCWTR